MQLGQRLSCILTAVLCWLLFLLAIKQQDPRQLTDRRKEQKTKNRPVSAEQKVNRKGRDCKLVKPAPSAVLPPGTSSILSLLCFCFVLFFEEWSLCARLIGLELAYVGQAALELTQPPLLLAPVYGD